MEFKRLMLFLAVLLLLPFSLKAQSPVDAGDFGVLVSQDSKPEFAYAIGTSYDVKKIGGPLFQFVSASILYSDRNWSAASETYVLRTITGREAHWKKAYAALGAGPWLFINTEGSDFAKLAFSLSLGYRTGPFDVHIGGQVVDFDGPNLHFLSAGIVIAGL